MHVGERIGTEKNNDTDERARMSRVEGLGSPREQTVSSILARFSN